MKANGPGHKVRPANRIHLANRTSKDAPGLGIGGLLCCLPHNQALGVGNLAGYVAGLGGEAFVKKFASDDVAINTHKVGLEN